MKSFMASPSTITRDWYVVDATGHTLGRLASEVASVLRGKNKPIFTPHMDCGDYVIIVNADKIKAVSYTHLDVYKRQLWARLLTTHKGNFLFLYREFSQTSWNNPKN